jgi:hypothetical protein
MASVKPVNALTLNLRLSESTRSCEVVWEMKMTMRQRYLALVLALVCASQALAQVPPCGNDQAYGCRTDTNGCLRLGCCLSDYCRKLCPVLWPFPRCGGPDDYCHKTIPCITCLPNCGSPDDYCRKTIPVLLCPPVSPFLQCGSVQGSCFSPK